MKAKEHLDAYDASIVSKLHPQNVPFANPLVDQQPPWDSSEPSHSCPPSPHSPPRLRRRLHVPFKVNVNQ